MKQYNLFEDKSYLLLKKIGDLDHYLYEIYWHSRTGNGLLTSGYLVKSEPDLSLVLVGQVRNKSKVIQILYPREFTNEPLPHQIDNVIDGETLIIDTHQGSLKLQADT